MNTERQVYNPVGMCADPRPAIYPATSTDEELITYVETYAKTQIEIELAKRLADKIDVQEPEDGYCQCCGSQI